MIRLLIADDHEILREGLKYVVSHSRDISVVGEADNAESMLQLCRTTPADVLLLDVSMPGPGVLDTIKNVKAIRPELRILVLSVHPEEQYARRVLAAGADGYLTKNHSSRELAAAVRQVHNGKKYLTASLAQELALALVRGRNTQDLHETLSNRESGVATSDFYHYFHTDQETPATVPWTGLEASTRAYARIIDEVNKLRLTSLQRPPES
jgi:two-component system, NarL family, invasion response regulator UvrY